MLQHIHTDGGTEWLGDFAQFCRENQIRQTFSCPYSQFQNQTAEQAVCLVKQGGRRNMLESSFDDTMWLHVCKLTVVQHNQSIMLLDLVHSTKQVLQQ